MKFINPNTPVNIFLGSLILVAVLFMFFIIKNEPKRREQVSKVKHECLDHGMEVAQLQYKIVCVDKNTRLMYFPRTPQ